MLIAHVSYGYAGTTHKVQGQTSEIHIASIDPRKDGRSLYVTATRARERMILVADARDWLNPSELARAMKWPEQQLDDEVIERAGAHLAGRPTRVDSATFAVQPVHHGPTGPRPGFGIAG
ncbi:MAG: hypothetical protein GC156_13540 [Actinomycetales bacterium]|nr:hypothetical protein [Actinomycetales bacterium]